MDSKGPCCQSRGFNVEPCEYDGKRSHRAKGEEALCPGRSPGHEPRQDRLLRPARFRSVVAKEASEGMTISPDTLRLAKLAVVLFKAKNKRLEIADILGINPNRIPRLLEIGGIAKAAKQAPSKKKVLYENTRKGNNMTNKETPVLLDPASTPKLAECDLVVVKAGRALTAACYGAAHKAGWWNDLTTGEPILGRPHVIGERLMLIVSEVAEAMEGHRKQLMDDKLPHRLMTEVELADAAIRIFDMGGAMGFDLGAAIAEKLEYNAKRADHKPENRKLDGGKKY